MRRSKSHGSQMPSPASTNPGPAPFALRPLGPPSHRRGVSAGASGRPRGAGRRGHDRAGPRVHRPLPVSLTLLASPATWRRLCRQRKGGDLTPEACPTACREQGLALQGAPRRGRRGPTGQGLRWPRGSLHGVVEQQNYAGGERTATVCVWQSPPGLALGRWASKGGVCLCRDATAANLWVGFPLCIKASCRKVDFSD